MRIAHRAMGPCWGSRSWAAGVSCKCLIYSHQCAYRQVLLLFDVKICLIFAHRSVLCATQGLESLQAERIQRRHVTAGYGLSAHLPQVQAPRCHRSGPPSQLCAVLVAVKVSKKCFRPPPEGSKPRHRPFCRSHPLHPDESLLMSQEAQRLS